MRVFVWGFWGERGGCNLLTNFRLYYPVSRMPEVQAWPQASRGPVACIQGDVRMQSACRLVCEHCGFALEDQAGPAGK